MYIKKVVLKNVRSVGDQAVTLEDLAFHNLFIGKNNSGKSNLVKTLPLFGDLFRHFPNLSTSFTVSKENSLSTIVDLFHNGAAECILSVELLLNDDEKNNLLSGLPDDNSYKNELREKKENTLFISFLLSHSDENLTSRLSELKWADMPLLSVEQKVMRKNNGELEQGQFDKFYSDFGSLNPVDYLKRMLSLLQPLYSHFKIIKAVRKAGSNLPNTDGDTREKMLNQLDLEGVDVIDKVFDWVNPVGSKGTDSRRKRKRINSFVSQLLGSDIELVTSGDKGDISMEDTSGNLRSLKSWGTSVEELIVLAVAILSFPVPSFIALEEPEIHLDPFLQRKLIKFLMDSTEHQYFISSHSNVLINSFASEDSSIYRVYKDGEATEVEKADPVILHDILDDLGVQASDILQSNGIIWVEGPSDRIYLNKWLSLKDSSLEEGIHYSIMFYGGKLLSHLSASTEKRESEIDEGDFIELVKLNKNIVVVMDSDRNKKGGKINKTKQRIEKEVKNSSDRSLVWITDGREIENYLPPQLFQEVLGIQGMNKFAKVSKLSKEKYIKVKAAEKLTEKIPSEVFESNSDLDSRMEALVAKIKQWNATS